MKYYLLINICSFRCAKNKGYIRDMYTLLPYASSCHWSEPDEASQLTINTCAFILEAMEENLELILTDLKHYKKGVEACCLPARYYAELHKLVPEFSVFLPCAPEAQILRVVSQTYKEGGNGPEILHYLLVKETAAFAYIMIAEGCSRNCPFYRIPAVCFKYRYFSYAEIAEECRVQIEVSECELVLLTQDTGILGRGLKQKSTTVELFKGLTEESPEILICMMYIQPTGVADKLLEEITYHEKICSYLDVPLKRSNAEIICYMNSSCSSKEYFQTLVKICSTIPHVNICTTLIAGYTREFDSVFYELFDFLEQAEFGNAVVLFFPAKEGKKATEIQDKIRNDAKACCVQELCYLAESVLNSKFAAKIVSTCGFIIQGFDPGKEMYTARVHILRLLTKHRFRRRHLCHQSRATSDHCCGSWQNLRLCFIRLICRNSLKYSLEMKKTKTKTIWTPANIVTLVRILLVSVFVVVILCPPDSMDFWLKYDLYKPLVAAVVFLLISLSDKVDGYLARRRGEVTDFGKFMDPLADKILVVAALLALMELRQLPSWPVLIIITREFVVSGLRMYASSCNLVIEACLWGKAKTVSQLIAIMFFIMKGSTLIPSQFYWPMNFFSWFAMVISLILTIVSMFSYMYKCKDLFKV
ncbi:MAG: CDP-diacylglycerol--glycerol-3-phosphate 3-phosphatidyltransferase [Eggerthellaceae bacterium]|nr:CDP-diacylglycerol--glycerol-3-phosphate 3-phosphatidyltransferase [Eggerthellaceae bacterium]